MCLNPYLLPIYILYLWENFVYIKKVKLIKIPTLYTSSALLLPCVIALLLDILKWLTRYVIEISMQASSWFIKNSSNFIQFPSEHSNTYSSLTIHLVCNFQVASRNWSWKRLVLNIGLKHKITNVLSLFSLIEILLTFLFIYFLVLTGSKDKTIRVWSTGQGKLLKVINLPPRGGGQRPRDRGDESGMRARVWVSLYWSKERPHQLVSSSHGWVNSHRTVLTIELNTQMT